MHLPVPGNERTFRSVEFQQIRTGTVRPCDINHPQRLVREFNDRDAVIVDLVVASKVVNLGDGTFRFAHQPSDDINAVTAQVEQRAAAGAFRIGEPCAGAAEPLIQSGGVRDAAPAERQIAEEPIFKRVFGEQDFGVASGRQGNHELHTGLLNGGNDGIAAINVNSECLLGEDMFSGFGGGNHDTRMV